MSLFDNLDENLLPTILQYVDQRTLPVLPLVSKAFRRQCRFVEVEWEFEDHPELKNESMINARENSLLTFFAFKATKISLRNYGINTSSDIVNIVRRFPHLRHLDMRRCWYVRSAEWDTFMDTLEHRHDGYLMHLEKFTNPYVRLYHNNGTFTSAVLKRMKAALPDEEMTDYDTEDTERYSEDYVEW